ncbi:hypothetical protein D3C85_1471560 [compost metagenome]
MPFVDVVGAFRHEGGNPAAFDGACILGCMEFGIALVHDLVACGGEQPDKNDGEEPHAANLSHHRGTGNVRSFMLGCGHD